LLSQAENAHRAGNNNLAAATADRVIQMSKQINTSAQNAKESAIVENQKAFWTKNISIIICLVVFVLIMFIVWHQFKQSYMYKKLEEKPEIINQ
jgi:CHASE3 domain sensor protein